MSFGSLQFFQSKPEPERVRFRTRLYIFLVCFLISVLLWLISLLSKEYSASLDIPIVYTRVPNNLILVNRPDSILSFRLEGSGYALFSAFYLRRKEPVDIHLDHLKIIHEKNGYTATIHTSKLSDEVTRLLGIEAHIAAITPENILLEFEAARKRLVPVIPRLDISFKKQFMLYDSVQISPDSVHISGLNHMIRDLAGVETETIKMTGLERSVILTIPLVVPSGVGPVQLSPEEVEVTLLVEEFTETMLELPVKFRGIHGESARTFPASVRLSFLVALKDFNRLDPSMFEVVARLSNAAERKGNLLPLHLEQHPPFIRLVRMEPDAVEFIIDGS
ncbi:MAG: YbbR-like domain-containing protein [Bacteroidales bacterium]|nr:YbbR-like domain-containing protein [Bacteroidales bacterium]